MTKQEAIERLNEMWTEHHLKNEHYRKHELWSGVHYNHGVADGIAKAIEILKEVE